MKGQANMVSNDLCLKNVIGVYSPKG